MTEKNKSCSIEDIYWERIFLNIIVYNDTGREIYLRYADEDIVHIEQRHIKNNTFEIKINLATIGGRTFLQNGKWEIGYYDSDVVPKGNLRYKPKFDEHRDDLFIFCSVSPKLAEKLDDLDKIFRYDGTKYAYTINFTSYTLDDETMHLNICSFFMRENPNWHRELLFFGSKKIHDMAKRYFKAFKLFVIRTIYAFFSMTHHNKSKHILIMNETKDKLDGNLKAIYEKMIQRQMDKEFHIEVSTREAIGKNNSIWSWIKTVRKAAKAEFIILDNFVPLFSKINISKKTKLIQVWHAGVGFKNVGFARFGKKGSPLPSGSVHQKYYKALAPAQSLVKVYEEVFGIDESAFMPLGMPRLDSFFDEKKISDFKTRFYKEYPQLKDKRLILFAPTYRGPGQKTAYYNYQKLDFQRLADFCGDEYVFALKMHPFTKDTPQYYEDRFPEMDTKIKSQRLKPDLSKFSPQIIDLTNKYDINDLFHVTDILITDYSSAFYEFSILKKPVLFYVYDRVIYENVRGVHQKINEMAPGKVCETFDELMSALDNQDYDIEKTIAFADDNFDDNFGNATDMLIDNLFYSPTRNKQ